MSLFTIENLTYCYPDSTKPALQGINLSLNENELLLVVGGSGSGKSTLARVFAGLVPYYYGGKIGGRVFFEGRELKGGDRRFLASRVGMVFQDPEKQLVMTSVEAEIAFGLENLGLPQREMFRRVAEVMSFLNFNSLREEFLANLSGGQKQKVALASVLAMQPRVLILDEPTSQLDPVAADEFLYLIERLNQEMGFTVVLIEQRLERCFHMADRLVVMDRGRIQRVGPVDEVARWQVRHSYHFLPPVARLFASISHETIPLTVKEGRKEVRKCLQDCLPDSSAAGSPEAFIANGTTGEKTCPDKQNQILAVRDLWFTYPNGREALKGINLSVKRGEFLAIIGENAAGKSTLLKQIAGILQPGRGQVTVCGTDTRKVKLSDMAGKVGYLSQNPNDYLFEDTVEEELMATLSNLGKSDQSLVEKMLSKLQLTGLRKANPRNLSGGERQRVALAAVLVAGPELLLLDEPTRGIDCVLKRELGQLLRELQEKGVTIILVTHDVEFAAEYAGQVVIMFDGRIAASGSKYEVLRDSVFYAPQIARLFGDMAEGVLTVEDAVKLLGSLRSGHPARAAHRSEKAG